jgi:hypothetical protein
LYCHRYIATHLSMANNLYNNVDRIHASIHRTHIRFADAIHARHCCMTYVHFITATLCRLLRYTYKLHRSLIEHNSYRTKTSQAVARYIENFHYAITKFGIRPSKCLGTFELQRFGNLESPN